MQRRRDNYRDDIQLLIKRDEELLEYLKNNYHCLNGHIVDGSGQNIGWLETTTGYYRANIKNKKKYIHQLVFLWHNNYIPKYIDHIDGNKTNNHIDNLRACTNQQNNWNKPLTKANKSGIKNVSFDKRRNKWKVQISIEGKNKFIGRFDDLELAELVAYEAREKFNKGFVNHG